MYCKIIELPSENEKTRIFEGDTWRVIVTDAETSLHLCIFNYEDGELVIPSDSKIAYIAKELFQRDNKVLPYYKTIPFDKKVVHLWEKNNKVKDIIKSWANIF